MLRFCLFGKTVVPFVLKHESTWRLDPNGNAVTLARRFHLTSFARILGQVEVGVGSLQWQGSLD